MAVWNAMGVRLADFDPIACALERDGNFQANDADSNIIGNARNINIFGNT